MAAILDLYLPEDFIKRYDEYRKKFPVEIKPNVSVDIKPEPSPKKVSLQDFSKENLDKIKKVLKIILDELELQHINRLNGNRISIKKFEKEGFIYDEITSLIGGINKLDNEPVIKLLNKTLADNYQLIKMQQPFQGEREIKEIFSQSYHISIDELKNYVILIVENLDRLKELYRTLESVNSVSLALANSDKQPISKLTIIEGDLTEDKEIKIVANDNYEQPIKVKRSTAQNGQHNNWEVLYRVAKKTDPLSERLYKHVLDYLNYNKECKLYKRSGLAVTNILKIVDGYIIAAIPMEVVSAKAYETRLNDQLKT